MHPTPKPLSAEYFLLTTLIVQVAVAAVVSTMLVRFPWFRRILLTANTRRSGQSLRSVSIGIPLAAGVGIRLLLEFQPSDLTLPGAFLAGLIAGPYAGAIVGSMVGLTALAGGEWI